MSSTILMLYASLIGVVLLVESKPAIEYYASNSQWPYEWRQDYDDIGFLPSKRTTSKRAPQESLIGFFPDDSRIAIRNFRRGFPQRVQSYWNLLPKHSEDIGFFPSKRAPSTFNGFLPFDSYNNYAFPGYKHSSWFSSPRRTGFLPSKRAPASPNGFLPNDRSSNYFSSKYSSHNKVSCALLRAPWGQYCCELPWGEDDCDCNGPYGTTYFC